MEDKQNPIFENKWNALLAWKRIRVDYPPHYHNYLELFCVLDGETTVSIDFVDYRLKPGDAALVFPNRIHAYRDSTKPIVTYIFMLPPELFPLFLPAFSGRVPAKPVLRGFLNDPAVMDTVERAHRAGNAETPFAAGEAAGHLALLLARMLPAMQLDDAPADEPSEAKLIGYCNEHFREPVTLDLLADRLRLSRFHISHLFTDRLKISLPRLLSKLRVEEACRLLRQGASVSDAAFGAGFGSIRSFNRVFREERGCNPSEYRARCEE